jgi:alpha-tubulin suppressor-like RCC1 family protein
MDAVLGMTFATALSSLDNHTCAILANRAVRCWGYNARGQLGFDHVDTVGDDPNDTITDLSLSSVLIVGAGGAHTCALTTNDDVFCWGRGQEGQLGYGTSDDMRLTGAAGPIAF